MLRLDVDPDPSRWLVLPGRDDDERAWIAAALDRLAERRDPFDAEGYADALARGLRQRGDADLWTLQWWPDASPVNVVVHVLVATGPSMQTPMLAEALPFAPAPFVDRFDAGTLGAGLEVRGAVPSRVPDAPRLAAVGHVLADGDAWIAVLAEPTLPQVAARLLHDQRELARSLRPHPWGGGDIAALPDAVALDDVREPDGAWDRAWAR